MLLLAGHATRKKNKIYEFPTELLLEELCSEKYSFIYLRHAIDGNYFSQLLVYTLGKKNFIIPLPSFPYFSIFRYLSEIAITIIIGILTAAISYDKVSFIGIDPLNALSGIFLTKLGVIKQTVFYSVDYSKKRFANSFLNNSYLYLDKFSAKHSDKVWNVSKRIFDLRKKQGIATHKNCFIPNVPSYINHNKSKKLNNIPTLITLGILDKQLDYNVLILAIEKYKKMGKPILLKIVGNGPMVEKLRKLIKNRKLEKSVILLGYLNHTEALEQIKSSDIGLALYNGEWSFNYYGDSLKCREYLAHGLPVITTNTHSTVEDIIEYEAGEIVSINENDYLNALEKILKKFESYSNNALLLGSKYDYVRLRRVKEII